jgi:hypothetical protein
LFLLIFRESYLRSGREELPSFRRSRSASVGIGGCASPQPNFLQSDQLISSPLAGFFIAYKQAVPKPSQKKSLFINPLSGFRARFLKIARSSTAQNWDETSGVKAGFVRAES